MLTDRSRIARSLCSTLAIATALVVGSGMAQAQSFTESFQGAGTVVSGGATITTGANTTNIDINGTNSDVVINWSTFDTGVGGGTINFQPSGTTATFQSTNAQFTVLNRILPTDPTRQVQFNGTVIGQLQGAATQTPAGTVYFYSPGGLIIGSTAVFNVGNLGLTSAAPVVDGTGCFDCGGPPGGGQVVFSAANAGTGVDIQAGAQITGTSPAPGNYVAVVAPRINNAGSISGKRVTALVSADAATMTINVNGLFDIQIDSGTSATGTTLFSNGSITGPAGDAGNVSRVYLVAVPKNSAITLAVGSGSTLGFDIADAVDVVGNAVVLSAGRDIVGGNISTVPSAGGGTGLANLNIANTAVTSSLRGSSTNDTFFFSTTGQTASAASSVNLIGPSQAKLSADGTGAVTTVTGGVNLNANATVTVGGANATAGTAEIFAINNGQVTVGGAFLNASGFGGGTIASGGTGGVGTGGIAIIQATSGGDVLINGAGQVIATGTGGANTSTGGGNGGVGQGGRAQIFARDAGSSVRINGIANAIAQGTGGASGTTGQGGVGTGGIALINAQAAGPATVTIGGATVISAAGIGGNGFVGGTGIGGTATAASSAGNDVQFSSTLDVFALGIGGNATGGNAGSATGGQARILLFTNGTMRVGGNTRVLSTGFTGSGNPNSALATGGLTRIEAQQNSTLNVTGELVADSSGIGSGAPPTVGTGSGAGGNTTVFVATGGSIDVTTNLRANSVGTGADGGNATGGNVVVQLNGGTLSGGVLEVSAEAFGGSIGAAGSGNGGIGTGGSASINVGAGSNTLTFNTINVTADAEGGDVSGTAGNGGAGVGGIAQISVTGGASLTVNAADTFIEADGAGRDSLSLTGNGGAGNAGRAILLVDGASATFNGNLSLSGDSDGGDGINGGSAFGDPESNQSRAVLVARNGSLAITGLTALHAVASGGTGNLAGNGGNASGGFANVAANNLVSGGGVGILTLGDLDIDSGAQGGSATGTGNGGNAGAGRAHLFANGGTITIGGTATLSGDAIGGDGVNGGNAISARPDFQPRALIGAFNGTIDVAGATALVASASGGSGRLGGTGGVAFAGQAAVDAQSPNGSSAITLGTLNIEASALGGFGGAGASGQVGGAGGDAYGGSISALGNAGRGVLTVRGSTLLRTGASGGTGGQGGGDETAPGAAGGAGGRAFGGALTVGTRSGVDTPSNTGSATFGQVSGDANALGGTGGAGGFGATQGAGGAGGSGFGGSAGILVRGSPATFGDVTLTANGTGGTGGAGAVQGDGGDGYAGDGFVNVTQRFMRTERGSLTANNVNITSAGIGGTGATVGDTFYSAATGAESDFFIRQSNVTLANLVLTTSGALAPNFTTTILRVVDPLVSGTPVPTSVTVAAEPFDLAMADSTASIAGAFTLSTPGNMRVSLANSTLNVGNLTLSAGNFVLPATRPATLGTINVSGGLTISTLLDFLAYANFNVGFNGAFSVGGSVLTGDLTLAGAVDIVAGGSITTGTISASDVALDAGQSILTAAITTGGDIDLDAGGTITTGALVAGDTVVVSAVGALNVASASAGIVNPSTNPLAEYNIGLRSLTSIVAGNLAARANVGVVSPGSITVGNVTTGGIGFLALAGTGLTTGSITGTAPTGNRVYLANFSMEALGGQIGGNFDPAPILAATPVAIAGPIAINGAVATGTLQAAATGTIAVGGAITTSATTSLSGAAGVTTGTIAAGQLAALVSSAGSVTAGAVTAGDTVNVAGSTGVTLGNVSAGIVNPSTNPSANYKIAIASGTGSVSTGTLTARRDIGVQAGQAIAAGNIAGRDVLLLPGTSLTTGSIQAGSITQPTGRIYIGNFSMATPTLNVFSPFTSLTFFNTNPVRTGGPININGSVVTGSLYASTAQAITLQSVTAGLSPSQAAALGLQPGFIAIDAGGLATINGALRAARHIEIASRDIDITATGSLDALSVTGEIQLASNNPNGAFIGDGLTAPEGSYRLSQAEYARLRAGEIAIIGDDLSGVVDLTIGTLSINAAQLYGANGVALFASGNRATQTPSGILRIAGAVTGTGFAATNEIDLLSGTVELEAVAGSLKVDNGSGGLGGLIVVEADHIHIASDAILTKLRADPRYTGHIDELNAPATVQRPDGVFNALGFEINVGKTFYIQNTGSRIVPAGFLTTFDATDVFASDSRPTGGVEIVINGQFRTSTGTVTGRAAFDQVIADPTADSEQFFGFSSTSQLNGCVFLSGVCAFGQSDPVAAISSQITVVTNAVLDESPVAPTADDSDEGDDGSSDKDEDDNTSDEGSSPIAPPTPLISTRALDGDVNVVEPVSGAGNPALFGSAVDETTVQGEKP